VLGYGWLCLSRNTPAAAIRYSLSLSYSIRIARMTTSLFSSTLRLATLAAALASSALAQSPLTPGNLVVVRMGDGTAGLSNAATAAFLDEYTVGGTLVQTIAMPTSAVGANQPLTNSGTATSEGFLSLSQDGNFLISAGYSAAPGTPSIAGTTSTTVPRVIAVTNLAGVVDTSTALDNVFISGNIRSATSTNGFDLWASGSNSAVVYTTLGSTTGVSVNAAPLNSRVVGTYLGQLYVTSSSGQYHGVVQVGSGQPTTSGNFGTILPGFPTSSGPSNYDFYFADPTTLYVADDRSIANGGGIQKWTESGGTWTLQYTLAPTGFTGCRAVHGRVQNGVLTLFATTGSPNNGNSIVSVVDTGAASVFSVVATAASNTVFRGLRMVPSVGSIGRLASGCGNLGINATGSGSMGDTVTTTIGNFQGLPFLGFGLQVGLVPLCPNCSLGHEWTASSFGSTNVFQVPTNPVFLGVMIGIQGADVFGSNVCTILPVTLSDTIVITIS